MINVLVGVPDNNGGLDTTDIGVTRRLRGIGGNDAVSLVADLAENIADICKDTERHPLSDLWHSIGIMTSTEKLRVLESLKFGDACWIQMKECPLQPLGVSVEHKEGKGYMGLIFDMFAIMSLNGKYDGYLESNDPNLLKIMRISSREESIKENIGENTDPNQIYIWTIKGIPKRIKIRYISSTVVVAKEVDEKGDWIDDDSLCWGEINNFLQEALPETV